jgi:hypothetical protein
MVQNETLALARSLRHKCSKRRALYADWFISQASGKTAKDSASKPQQSWAANLYSFQRSLE